MRQVVLSVPAHDGELAADRLWAAGANGVELRELADDAVELRAVLAAADRTSLARLGALPDPWTVSFEEADDAPAQTWREFARPIEVNRELIVRPAWLAGSRDVDRAEIEIEPGSSFGLGDHPTTRLAADAVWRLVRGGERMLDVGCGSGVLSIVGVRRGAACVLAIDVAEAAREATEQNAARNGVSERIIAGTTPVGEVEGEFDVVVANILAPVLVSMADDLKRLTAASGRLVVSGVLANHYEHVLAALAPMRVITTTELEGWAAVELRH